MKHFNIFQISEMKCQHLLAEPSRVKLVAQELLILLEDDMSDIRDADLANLLTKIEFLMTNREAAQATFTRITSKSLFDYLG